MVVARSLGLLLVLSLLNSCFIKWPQTNKPAIQINEDVWSLKEFEKEFEFYLKSFSSFEKSSPEHIKTARDFFIQQLIFHQVLKMWAEKNNIKVSYKLQENKSSLFKFRDKNLALSNKWRLYESIHRSLIKDLSKKISNPTLNKQQQYYNKNKSRFYLKPKCLLKEIRLSSKQLANRLSEQISQGDSFNKIADLYSPNTKSFWMSQDSNSIFSNLCLKNRGFISPAIKSSFGWHILLVVKKQRGKQKRFKDSQKEIVSLLKKPLIQKEMEKWLKSEVSQTKIFIDKNLLDKIHIQYKR